MTYINDILFVNHAGDLGGAELCLLNYIERTNFNGRVLLFSSGAFRYELEDQGIKVDILPRAREILSIHRGSSFSHLVRAAFNLTGLIFSIVKRLRTTRIVYANSQKAAALTAVAAVFTRTPMVWHLHDIMTAPDFSGINRRLVIAATNLTARLVIANSEATAEAYREVGGTRPVAVVPNGIDPLPFDQIDRSTSRSLVRDEFGIPDVPILGFFGRICRWKGQDVAIRALKDVSGAHIVFVGAAFFGENDYAVELIQLAAEFGVTDRVHFAGFRRDVPLLMRGMDVLLHCSTEPEPFGRVIVEGMMAQVPVIAARGGGATEILEGTGAGILLPPGDVNVLAATLIQLLASDGELAAMGQIGGLHARRYYTAEAVNRRTNELLAPFLAGRYER
ncbi:glycosyltransferase family 4 protein [Sphingomonas sp. PL20]|uniref:glycosyltransferase family 4 protein n=1 Tax=Sphingomonas sp. PL20 TaxID=2760712 RepID=UPI001AEA369F